MYDYIKLDMNDEEQTQYTISALVCIHNVQKKVMRPEKSGWKWRLLTIKMKDLQKQSFFAETKLFIHEYHSKNWLTIYKKICVLNQLLF